MSKIFVTMIFMAVLIGCGTNTYQATAQPGAQGATGPTGTSAAGATGPTGAKGSNGSGFAPGLLCDVYSVQPADESGTVNWFKMFSDGTLRFSKVFQGFDVPDQNDTLLFPGFNQAQQSLVGDVNFAMDCSGFLLVPESGDYNFMLQSDDGSELVIDSNVIADMPQLQSFQEQTVNDVSLYAGFHTINVLYFQGLPTQEGLMVQWRGPANQGLSVMEPIPVSALSY